MNITPNTSCPREDIAAYLDGELTNDALNSFETHLESCSECASELRLQRQLLCALDVAFNGSQPFDLPNNFSRVIAKHAETDFSGMRQKSERKQALKLCAVLALLSFALLGAASRTLVFDPIRSFWRIIESLAELVWRTTYDAGTGILVIIRVTGRGLVSEAHGLGWLLLIFFISISLLPLLIARYHRTQIIE